LRGFVKSLFKRDSADMDGRMVRWGLAVLVVALWAWFPAHAEFFKYTDKAGKTYYVDEVWKIPEQYRHQVGRYREKYDHLPAEQKVQVIEADQERQKAIELEQQRQTETHLQEMHRQQEAERLLQMEDELHRRVVSQHEAIHAIAKAVILGAVTRDQPFICTPKMKRASALSRALLSVPEELVLLSLLWGSAAAVLYVDVSGSLELKLFTGVMLVQSLPYLAAVAMAFISALPQLKALRASAPSIVHAPAEGR